MNLTTNLRTAFAALAFLPGALTACSSDPAEGTTATNTPTSTATSTSTSAGATTDGGSSTTGGLAGCLATTADDGSLSLLVNPANNYAFDSTVTLTVQTVAPNTPLNFDWSGLTLDIQQQAINPAGGEVKTVLLALLGLTKEGFETKLNANAQLNNDSKAAMAFYPTTQTVANMYEFSAPGNATPLPPEEINPYLDPAAFPPESHVYAVLIQDETEPAHGVRMVQAFQLDPNSLVTDVVIDNNSSSLVYHTDLTTVAPVQIPVDNANITADWKGMNDVANNALGDVWLKGSIEEVMIGRYDLTPQQLTEQFLGLENIAAEMYRAPVPQGSTLNLSALVEETTGAPFAGINATGTWILALNCTKCTNPAPWFLTILTPCQ